MIDSLKEFKRQCNAIMIEKLKAKYGEDWGEKYKEECRKFAEEHNFLAETVQDGIMSKNI